MKKLLFFILLFGYSKGFSQARIVPTDAAQHIGENVIITGIIYGGHFFESSASHPTILNIGDTFPNPPLTLFIHGNDINKFPAHPVQYYFNKKVIVNGTVILFQGTPEVILTDSSQIVLLETSANLSFIITPSPDIVNVNIDTYDGCPPTGETTTARLQSLNRNKNRYNFPSGSDIDPNASLQAMLKKGNDENRWSTTNAAEITGYVYEVKPGGSETCNCHKTDPDHTDTHIVLVTSPTNTAGSKRVIIEITPRMRFLMKQKGIDWSTSTLKTRFLHQWVTVQGWLFFDGEHKAQSENTNPGNAKNWRGTAWEIHPITSIEQKNN